jgi:radical SAM-linked protein
MNIAAALPLGFSSRCEVLDMRLEYEISLDGLRERLQDTLPMGIQVSSIESVDEKSPALQTQVASAEYEVTLTEPVDGSELERKIDAVMESESIIRERRGKTYDLRPLIEELKIMESDSSLSEQEHTLTSTRAPALQKIYMRLAAREGATGRPEEVLDMLGIAFEGTRIERTQLIFSNNLTKA